VKEYDKKRGEIALFFKTIAFNEGRGNVHADLKKQHFIILS